MNKYLNVCVIILFLFSCKKEHTSAPNDREKATIFLNNIVTTMEQYSFKRDSIDWNTFRKKVLLVVDDYRGFKINTSLGIQRALTLLADNHSSFIFLDKTELWGENGFSCTDTTPEMASFDSTIGYIKVATFMADPKKEEAYESDIHQQIQVADNQQIKGWIVDLRGNRGGYFYPMFVGVAPILGTGTTNIWKYPDGSESYTTVNSELLNKYYQLIKPNPKVAVLTDHSTASSGEALTISFRGRPNTRSFGNSTCGVSTERKSYEFTDVGSLNLATGIMADRTGKAYGYSVAPDVPEANSLRAMQEAINWLKE
jgi:carboxyl-terminal processing protease